MDPCTFQSAIDLAKAFFASESCILISSASASIARNVAMAASISVPMSQALSAIMSSLFLLVMLFVSPANRPIRCLHEKPYSPPAQVHVADRFVSDRRVKTTSYIEPVEPRTLNLICSTVLPCYPVPYERLLKCFADSFAYPPRCLYCSHRNHPPNHLNQNYAW